MRAIRRSVVPARVLCERPSMGLVVLGILLAIAVGAVADAIVRRILVAVGLGPICSTIIAAVVAFASAYGTIAAYFILLGAALEAT